MATKKITAAKRTRAQNMKLQGAGDTGAGDRGAGQSASLASLNPWDNANYYARWQEYTRWYMKAWEARKIVDIPVNDAWRVPFKITGLAPADADFLMAEWDRLKAEQAFRRGCKQERLLGGCALYMGVADAVAATDYTDQPINPARLNLQRDGFKCLNVVDANRIARADVNNDPLSDTYEACDHYQIDGKKVHRSRLIIFDGKPLFGRANMMFMTGAKGFNPAGFGESILTPLYDDLVRATGARDGAYHLINLASVLLASVKDFKTLAASKPGEQRLAQIAAMVQSISIYRAAVLDGQDAKFEQHSATFGSVPELVMSFLQVLSAASDIPATRFLGQAPGGLNATGESDLENYYNSIDEWQRGDLRPRMLQIFDIIGVCRFGTEQWAKMRTQMDLEFPPLWNASEDEQADTAGKWITAYKGLYDSGLMTADQISAELNARRVFLTKVELEEMLQQPEEEPPIDPTGELAKLAGSDDDQGPPKPGQEDKPKK
jgi:hypothetical protein